MKDKLTCYNEKNQHMGNLKRIASFPECDVDRVVMWCHNCGAVVIYNEVDGRIMNSFIPMKFPKITVDKLKGN